MDLNHNSRLQDTTLRLSRGPVGQGASFPFCRRAEKCRDELTATGPRHHLGVRIEAQVLFLLLSNHSGPGNAFGGRTGEGPLVGSKSGCCARHCGGNGPVSASSLTRALGWGCGHDRAHCSERRARELQPWSSSWSSLTKPRAWSECWAA